MALLQPATELPLIDATTTTTPSVSSLHSSSIWDRIKSLLRHPNTYPMIMLSLLFAFINADQNLLSPQLSVIAHDFNMTNDERDEQLGGWLSLGFFIIGGTCTILIGLHADSITFRVKLLCVVVALGEFSCFCTLWVTEFWGLFVSRSFTGISVGGSQPLVYSLLSDMFTAEERGRAASFITIAYGGGILIGQSMSSGLGPVYGWRVPFAVVSAITLTLVPIVFLTVHEPIRGSKEKAQDPTYRPDKVTWIKIKSMLKNITVLLSWIQGIPGSVTWGVVLVYLQDALVNDISKGQISIQQSSVVILCFAAGEAVATVLGGFISDRLWLIKYELVIWYISISTILSTVPLYLLLNSPPLTLLQYSLYSFPAGFLVAISSSALKSVLLNVTLPETRGTAWAGLVMFDDLGKGLGPYWVSVIILGSHDRIMAFNYALLGWIASGVVVFGMVFTVRRDVLAQHVAVGRMVVGDGDVNNNINTTAAAAVVEVEVEPGSISTVDNDVHMT